ncbi:DUF397 domain-containing protein [Nocardiopsis rhodophaea]|uniref:DUF397 domain-containing protein n=1 Tax=Nocardiopsis rhodophaea TaxID=280238 RepID=UPI0031D40F14
MPYPLHWTKSSYSGGDTQECVEVATSWKKSSYSTAKGEECVEIGLDSAAQCFLRDSKHPLLGILDFDSSEWSRFVGRLKLPDAE